MIELVQVAWSPYCIVQRRILEFAQIPFKSVGIPNADRSLVWKLTRGRYYGVPIIRDGRQTIFEVDHDSQVIAKYLDDKFRLGLFPRELDGVQHILWRYIENDCEDIGFRLNDIYWREFVPKDEQVAFIRHKERKFGRGCLDQWRRERKVLLEQWKERLLPFEQMLGSQHFLLGDRPRFVDFDLFGILGNFLYTGHNRLPPSHTRLKQWYQRLDRLQRDATTS